jgi:Ser/Thr protein kinase RdoA (MazF antagonist)
VFTSSSVLPVLRAACVQAGFSAAGAELLRLGENAIWRLDGVPVVVRIARTVEHLDKVRKELCVARWLAGAGVPVVRVTEVPGQPLVVDGHPVTFWVLTDGVGPVPSQLHLARLLKSFHGLGGCPCGLPDFDSLPVSRERTAGARDISDDDRSFLLGVCDELEKSLADLKFALPRGPIHGDAHAANLLADRGQVVLLDFESSAIGPREWDLLPTAIAVDRYGLNENTYREFAAAYGFDVRTWAGYPVLRRMRELTMTTWMAQNAGSSEAIGTEFRRRVSSLREGEFRRAWNAF